MKCFMFRAIFKPWRKNKGIQKDRPEGLEHKNNRFKEQRHIDYTSTLSWIAMAVRMYL